MAGQDKEVGVTAISKVEPDRVTVRGKDLASELIGKMSYTAYFLFLLTGKEPSAELVKLADATMVAIAEHGFVPSIQAARMTYAAAPNAMQGAVAAGLLGCGPVILGASSEAGEFFAEILAYADSQNVSLTDAAATLLRQRKTARQPVPGFGHPIHREEDPRSTRLLAYARELGTAGRHVDALLAVEETLEAAYGRALPMNVSAAIPAVLLDAGFPLHALLGIPMVARTGSLIAHLYEEKETRLGFKLAARAEAGVRYEPAENTDTAAE
ncbi:citryl-CoA lyase [Bordetella sp. 02P26C-1]|uniref:citryl-CoA lyase n=1 Tax=Bordetella sp. 02P26C-1 TaxID=2683195 RepID=UPI0013555B4B|nr:citryl-CoA lyase [Bordetella sp. 02P26C-1]MVW78095.1 citryl-CoA lyase [Bordetella sp. 02P26C-1]